MMVRTLRGALAMNFGFDPDRAVALRVDLATLRFTPAQGRDFQRRLISRIREIPGIEAAALALLTGISLVACVLPARRALRIQPSDALRHE